MVLPLIVGGGFWGHEIRVYRVSCHGRQPRAARRYRRSFHRRCCSLFTPLNLDRQAGRDNQHVDGFCMMRVVIGFIERGGLEVGSVQQDVFLRARDTTQRERGQGGSNRCSTI